MLPDTQSTAESLSTRPGAREIANFLSRAGEVLGQKPFRPHPLFNNRHAQTLAGYAWPRRYRLESAKDEERIFEVATDIKLLAHCRWRPEARGQPTIVLWHGIEGSSSSVYMLSMAEKGYREGFNVIRMNLRNCGGTEHLTSTLYHGGLSEDLRAVINELIERDGLSEIFVVGFSLGGNLVLKFAGELGSEPPREVSAVCAVSPSVDLAASADAIRQRSNRLYQRDFLRRMRKRIKVKQKLFPELYDLTEIGSVRTIRDFDERFTATAHGFVNADDYYYRASAIRVMDQIRLPTLIIHAQDDPFIPFAPLNNAVFAANGYILLLAPERGGHVAFVASGSDGEDRFWAENRVVEFCRLVVQDLDGQGKESP